MKLVSSNDPNFVRDTIQEAVAIYEDKSDVPAALEILTRVKGIGPATASLLLAVHDPANVIFFGDEAFHWLCSGGTTAPIKYNAKEYKSLNGEARTLAKRLGVTSVDVEKAAFVIMRRDESVPGAADVPPKQEIPKPISKRLAKLPAKRKTSAEDVKTDQTSGAPLRRSKRGRET